MPDLEKKRSRAHKALARRQRKLARKLGARKQLHKLISNAVVRIRRREDLRSRVGELPRERLISELKELISNKEYEEQLKSRTDAQLRERLRERLTNLIQDDKRQIERQKAQIKELNSVIQRLRDVIPNIKDKIENLTRRIKRKKRREDRDEINISPGSPHWGGCRDIMEQEVYPAAGGPPHSAKRTETFGNPGSDHHVSQTIADAGDWAPSVTRAIAIGRSVGVPYFGLGNDYQLFFFVRDGHTYRIQIIASNHGTGPHVHAGMERQS